MIRAIRNRYFARSAPGSADHGAKARRAAVTARLMSASPAVATSASTSSVAGLTVLKTPPPSDGATNCPSMNRP
jgi:hypothetical protein